VGRKVLVIMGSENDLEAMRPAAQALEELGVEYVARVASAHRTPEKVVKIARSCREDGFGVILAGAGGAHHLGGVLAANTTLPVVAIPLAVGSLGGLDALLSAVQLPGGVPAAGVGVGGARNAGLFAAAILAIEDAGLAKRLDEMRARQEAKVAEGDERVQKALAPKK